MEELIEARLKVMSLQEEIKARERELADGSVTESLADPELRNADERSRQVGRQSLSS